MIFCVPFSIFQGIFFFPIITHVLEHVYPLPIHLQSMYICNIHVHVQIYMCPYFSPLRPFSFVTSDVVPIPCLCVSMCFSMCVCKATITLLGMKSSRYSIYTCVFWQQAMTSDKQGFVYHVEASSCLDVIYLLMYMYIYYRLKQRAFC